MRSLCVLGVFSRARVSWALAPYNVTTKTSSPDPSGELYRRARFPQPKITGRPIGPEDVAAVSRGTDATIAAAARELRARSLTLKIPRAARVRWSKGRQPLPRVGLKVLEFDLRPVARQFP